MLNKNYVSYTLYGEIKKYIDILSNNIEILKKHDFEIIIYCDLDNLEYLKTIYSNVLIVDGFQNGIKNKMLWRLNPVFSSFSDSIFPRDADSKITEREIILMKEFLISNYKFHIIRDHELHYMPIMGGLFGVKKSLYSIFKQPICLKKLKNTKNIYNYDQYFLSDSIYPIIKETALIHSSSYNYITEKICKIQKVEDYCGKYDNKNVAKFDILNDYLKVSNRKPIYYIIAKLLRYKWFLFIKNNNEK